MRAVTCPHSSVKGRMDVAACSLRSCCKHMATTMVLRSSYTSNGCRGRVKIILQYIEQYGGHVGTCIDTRTCGGVNAAAVHIASSGDVMRCIYSDELQVWRSAYGRGSYC